MPKKQTAALQISWRPLVFAVVMTLACVVITPQIDQLRVGFRQLLEANGIYLALAAISVCGAVIASGGTYTCLALKIIGFWRTAVVQVAGMFVNRLLPAGVGGMGLNVRYLYVQKHTIAQATTVAGMNNLLTGVGHFILLILAVSLFDVAFPDIQMPSISFGVVVFSLVFFIGVLLVLARQFSWMARVKKFMTDVVVTLNAYKTQIPKLSAALLFAMGNTLSHTVALYCCMLAFDVHLSIAISLLVLTGGVAAASVTPTPGGVIGAEAGLAAGFIGFGVDAPTAIAIAVSYRVVSYWLPLIPGAATFFYIQQKKYI